MENPGHFWVEINIIRVRCFKILSKNQSEKSLGHYQNSVQKTHVGWIKPCTALIRLGSSE